MNRSRFLLLSLSSLCWALPGAAQMSPSKWLSYDPATKTVTFELVAGTPGTSGPLNFNGYDNGAATLVVPPGSSVVMNFVNRDGPPHSAELIADTEPMPNMGGNPAIPGASTQDVTLGLPENGRDVMHFTAPSSGSFRIFSGVPGEGLFGMWIRFKVDPAASSPSWETSPVEPR